jgi:hypothetical protein
MRVERKSSSLMLPLVSLLVLLVAAGGCSDRPSPTGVQAPAARSASVIGSDIAYGALDYKLTSFDVSTLTLRATTNLYPGDPYNPGDPYIPTDPYRTFAASFTTGTRFSLARLDLYVPSDPYCPTLAANYNASLAVATSDGGLFYSLIGQMAASHCNARVLVDLQGATIRAFQPVP